MRHPSSDHCPVMVWWGCRWRRKGCLHLLLWMVPFTNPRKGRAGVGVQSSVFPTCAINTYRDRDPVICRDPWSPKGPGAWAAWEACCLA